MIGETKRSAKNLMRKTRTHAGQATVYPEEQRGAPVSYTYARIKRRPPPIFPPLSKRLTATRTRLLNIYKCACNYFQREKKKEKPRPTLEYYPRFFN